MPYPFFHMGGPPHHCQASRSHPLIFFYAPTENEKEMGKAVLGSECLQAMFDLKDLHLVKVGYCILRKS